MTAGTKSNFQIYDEQYYTGMTEVLMQNSALLNEGSLNTIRLVPQIVKGEYEKTSFMDLIAGLTARRDPTSLTATADTPMEQSEHVAVKVNRRLGPIANTKDSFRKIATDPGELSLILGRQAGKAIAVDYVNTALASIVGAIKSNSSMYSDKSSNTITHSLLNGALALMGDQASQIVAWVMHSSIFYSLIGQTLTDKITNVANVAVFQGTTGTFGRPVIITDSTNLITPAALSSGTDTYHVLGLVPEACVLKESEEREAVLDTITGLANIVIRYQGEYAFNVGVKGYAYQTGQGVNPTNATLASSASWSKVVTDNKNTLGVMLNVKAA